MEIRTRSDLKYGEIVVVDMPDGSRVVAVSDRLASNEVAALLERWEHEAASA